MISYKLMKLDLNKNMRIHDTVVQLSVFLTLVAKCHEWLFTILREKQEVLIEKTVEAQATI